MRKFFIQSSTFSIFRSVAIQSNLLTVNMAAFDECRFEMFKLSLVGVCVSGPNIFYRDIFTPTMYLQGGVFVHLHLALFPAGGPFLPSLSVNLLYLQGLV
jgi:hypothetical protein